ncbi:glycosyl hydrolase family 28-related protein [Neobacillus dielmonensis]|uniref:glycosyl hydrolase family 28-related protein n=1 Tax=Neobacillus dielmonensis TaxID=1347369 RepID=UPI0005A74194|nr:glycosyl hydrolase family 28-related protein [Neobacillus dielmonensis]
MLDFDKNYNPKQNAGLLNQLSGMKFDLKAAVEETVALFKQYSALPPKTDTIKTSASIKPKWTEALHLLLAKRAELQDPSLISVDETGNVSPEWKEHLDKEYRLLHNTITREVNLLDYGAIGDGKNDCTAAFKKAIGRGRVRVIVPKGVFITKEIRLPSWTCLIGAGKGQTIIRLHENAHKRTRLVTNANHWRGNHHICVQDLSLDWNAERLGNTEKTSTWGNHSSCLTYANVTFGWVKEVEAINAGLHGFDISSTLYNYAGDGWRARGGSKFIWLDKLTGYGFGDDGITTHHSEYVWISNCHMCDPSGRAHQKGFSNSNGIEVDDGSCNILLVNNSTARCFGGVEIKAHQNSSAASSIQIVGHISVHDNRSFNFRHIGHHKITDSMSKTARNILGINLVSFAPVPTELYKGSTPRGLVVSAYHNVVLNHVTFIGDGDPRWETPDQPIAAIQYRAENVILNHFAFRNFKNASAGIKVFGGENHADTVQIINVYHDFMNADAVVQVGSNVRNIKIENIHQTINGKYS